MINLEIYPQTSLLFLLDALKSTGKSYRLDLYLDPKSLGGVLWEITDAADEGKMLYGANTLQELMAWFVAKLQAAASEQAGEALAEPASASSGEPVASETGAVPDATGSV